MIAIAVDNSLPMTCNNFGIYAEQALTYMLTGEIRTHDKVPFDKGSDIPEFNMSVKSGGFSLASGNINIGDTFEEKFDDFMSRVVSDKFAYITRDMIAYIMNKAEFGKFVHIFCRLGRESSSKGGKTKIRCLNESQKMRNWLANYLTSPENNDIIHIEKAKGVKTMDKKIYFDLDGTMVDFYGVQGWLTDLENRNTRPYEIAKPLVNMSYLARTIHQLQRNGYKIGVISWTSKSGDENYHNDIEIAKRNWLRQHIPSVVWDEIHIIQYGTPKSLCGNGYLFDDELRNREEWGEGAYDEKDLIKNLRSFLTI